MQREDILNFAKTPQQYLGNEIYAVKKNPDAVKLRI